MKRLRSLFQPLILGLALLFLALLLRSQWAELSQFDWHLRPVVLLASGGLLVASWFLEVWIWRFGLATLGGSLPYAQAVQVWFASILVRYVPGNIWQPLGMTVLARERGVQPEVTVTSIALYQAVNLLAVLPFGGLLLLLPGLSVSALDTGMLAGGIMMLALLPGLLFLLWPKLLPRILNWGLARLGRPTIATTLTHRQTATLIALALVDWLLWGLGFSALVAAVVGSQGTFSFNQVPALLAAYPVAYAAGYLSLLTPGGLGVREGALVLMLTPVLGTAQATVAALAMRIWQALLELLVAAVVASIPRLHTRSHQPQTNGT